MRNPTDKDYDDRHAAVQAFHAEFIALVRKYMPKYPRDDFEADTLAMLQEKTSCFNPSVWPDRARRKP